MIGHDFGWHVLYKDYIIERTLPPGPGKVVYTFRHQEYDGDSEDRRCGNAASLDEALQEIDEIEGQNHER